MTNHMKMLWVISKNMLKNKLASKNYMYVYVLIPMVNTLFYLYLNTNNGLQGERLIVDISLMTIWSINIFYSSFMIIEERELNTLVYSITSKYSIHFIYYIKTLSNMVLNIFTLIVIFGVSFFWIDLNDFVYNLKYYIVAYGISILSISTIGLLLSIVLLYTRIARGIMNIIEYPFYLLSGLFISLSFLPENIVYISYLLPTTCSFEMFSDILKLDNNLFMKHLITAILVNLIYHVIIGILFKKIKSKIIYNGDLEKF